MASSNHQHPSASSTHQEEPEMDAPTTDAADILVSMSIGDHAQVAMLEAGETLMQMKTLNQASSVNSYLKTDADFQKALEEIHADSTAEAKQTVQERIRRNDEDLKAFDETARKIAEFKRCGMLSKNGEDIFDYEGYLVDESEDPHDTLRADAEKAMEDYVFKPSHGEEDDPLRLVCFEKKGKGTTGQTGYKIMRESEMSDKRKRLTRRDLLGPSPTIIETKFGELPHMGMLRGVAPWEAVDKYLKETVNGIQEAKEVQDLLRHAPLAHPETNAMSLKEKMTWLHEQIVNEQEWLPNVITPWVDSEFAFSKACKNPGKEAAAALEDDLEAMLGPNDKTKPQASSSRTESTVTKPTVAAPKSLDEDEREEPASAPITDHNPKTSDVTPPIASGVKRKATEEGPTKPFKKAKTAVKPPTSDRPRPSRAGQPVATPWDLESEIVLLEMQATPGFKISQSTLEQDFTSRMPVGAASRTFNALRMRLKILNDAGLTADGLRRGGKPYSQIEEERKKAAKDSIKGAVDDRQGDVEES